MVLEQSVNILNLNFSDLMSKKVNTLPMMSSQDALVAIMVAVSASDDRVSKENSFLLFIVDICQF